MCKMDCEMCIFIFTYTILAILQGPPVENVPKPYPGLTYSTSHNDPNSAIHVFIIQTQCRYANTKP